jgi:hypothetical protein
MLTQRQGIFEERVLAEVNTRSEIVKKDYEWLKNNTNWQGVSEITNQLTAYGADTIVLSDARNYLETKLRNVVHSSSNSVLCNSSLRESVNDFTTSLEYSQDVYRLYPYSSMDLTPGGSLRASVAIILAIRIGTTNVKTYK